MRTASCETFSRFCPNQRRPDAAQRPQPSNFWSETLMQIKARIAVLDDYQGVAMQMADWSFVKERAEIVVFKDHLDDVDALVERLQPFEVVNVMRERTPLPRARLERLP